MQRTLHLLLALLGTAAVASAAPQLDLPKERRSAPPEQKGQDDAKSDKTLGNEPGDVASRRVTNTEKKDQLRTRDGNVVGEVTTRRVNTPGRRQKGSGARKLMLPSKRRETPPPASTGAPATGASAAGAAAAADPSPTAVAPLSAPGVDDLGPAGFPSTRNSARFLYEQLLKARKPSDPEVAEAADRLARLGEDGLEVGRFALRQESDVLAYAGARAMLAGGQPADADEVVRVLRGNLPGKVAPMVLDELVDRDPVRANEQLLADLLRHDSAVLRRSAKRHLEPLLEADEAHLLAPALEDRSTDVRRAAVDLLVGLEGPLPTELLIDRVTDRSARVSQVAIRALRTIESEDVDFELLRRVMESGEILRREALLLVAIVEREDRLVRPILGPQHTPPLVTALQSPLPLVQSTAALGLAGVGFRSPATDATQWMDGPVPSALVGVAAGFTYFDGFEIVREPALRRLREITSVSHGNNGPAWSRWWTQNKAGFRASRAVIDVRPEDEQVLVVSVRDTAVSPAFSLVGPALAADDEWVAMDPNTFEGYLALQREGDVFFLTQADATELAALLRDEGVFGSERLPGPRGAFGADGRSLEVSVQQRSKSFLFGSGRTMPWFDRVLSRTHGLSDRNAWQRFPVAGVHEDQRALFLAEGAWWSEPREQAERDARFKSLLVQHLIAAAPVDRDPAIAELSRLCAANEALVGIDDLPVLLELLVQEPRFNERSRSLVGLLRIASASGTDELSRATAAQILATLHDRFGPAALPAMGRLLGDQGRDAVLAAVVDERGLVRVAGADVLATGTADEDIDLLIGLLDDADIEVRIAAVRALGGRGAVRARSKIVALADRGEPQLRMAALRAVGEIGGPGAIDALVAGLTDPDQRYHLPAAEGLARIEEKEAAPLLVSLLRGATRGQIRDQARDGLMRLGDRAHDDLFAAMRSPNGDLRRESALILAIQLEPRAVPVLARSLAENPDDADVVRELVVLTCVDYSDEPLPADRWFQWWDEVDRRDPFSWFLASLERRNLRAPAREEFDAEGTPEARLFLLSIISESGDPVLSERALRELERLQGEALGPIPVKSGERDGWLEATRGRVLAERRGGDSR